MGEAYTPVSIAQLISEVNRDRGSKALLCRIAGVVTSIEDKDGAVEFILDDGSGYRLPVVARKSSIPHPEVEKGCFIEVFGKAWYRRGEPVVFSELVVKIDVMRFLLRKLESIRRWGASSKAKIEEVREPLKEGGGVSAKAEPAAERNVASLIIQAIGDGEHTLEEIEGKLKKYGVKREDIVKAIIQLEEEGLIYAVRRGMGPQRYKVLRRG